MVKSLKKIDYICIFHHIKKSQKIVFYFCIFIYLITSLLKPRELGLHFKNNKKLFCFFLIHGITNLHVKHIPYIKFKKHQKIYFVFY